MSYVDIMSGMSLGMCYLNCAHMGHVGSLRWKLSGAGECKVGWKQGKLLGWE